MTIKTDNNKIESLPFKQLALCSSLLFFLGMPLSVASIVISADYDKRWIAATLGTVGWGVVGTSVIPEIVIDSILLWIGKDRPNSHARYGRRPMLLHWLQTIVFFFAVMLAGLHSKRSMDYDYLSNEDTPYFFQDKHYLLTVSDLWLASSYLFVVSGLLASYSTKCICCGCGRKPERRPGGPIHFVKVGNCTFLVSSIAFLLAYFNSCDDDTCFLGYVLLMGSHCGFLAAGLCWVIADCEQLLSKDIMESEREVQQQP